MAQSATDILQTHMSDHKLSKEEWKSFDFRQKTFEVHRHTETIPIIYNEDFREIDLHYWPCYKKFKTLFKNFLSRCI